ncbi:MAG: prepilin peptidase [Nitrospinota bacterium]
MDAERRKRTLACLGLGALVGVGLVFARGPTAGTAVQAFGLAFVIAGAISDALWGIIPNSLSLTGLAGVLLASVFLPEVGSGEVVLGAIVGGGTLLLLGLGMSRLLRREALGGGDVKLMALIGSVLGWEKVFPVLFWAAVLALAWIACLFLFRGGSLRRSVHFGPWMGLAAVLAMVLR